MFYVFSTLACDQRYTLYGKGPSDLPRAMRSVFIKGGAGIPGKYLETPQGVMTKVSEEEMQVLKQVRQFQQHMERGFIRVEEAPADPEKVAADMNVTDNGKPDTPADYENMAAQPVNNQANKGRNSKR